MKLFIFCLLMMTGNVFSQMDAPADVEEYDAIAFGFHVGLPKTQLGFQLMTLKASGMGFYGDIRLGIPVVPDKDLYEDVSRNQAENIFGDEYIGSKKDIVSADIGITHKVIKNTWAFAAIGFTITTKYRRYHDHLEILGSHGKYYIEGKDSYLPNGMLGLLFRANKTVWQIGGQTTPPGAAIGVNMSIPWLW